MAIIQYVLILLPNSILKNLDGFANLNSLIVDSNALSANQFSFPHLPKLHTLCVNDNEIDDIEVWLGILVKCAPKLTYLSMLKNPACPNYFIGRDQDDYARYRLYVLSRIPRLKFLDSTNVTAAERAEAERVGHLMRIARPQQQQQQAQDAANDEQEQQEDEEHDEFQEGLTEAGKGKSSFGVCRYVYYGKQSEGNRFILNDDL